MLVQLWVWGGFLTSHTLSMLLKTRSLKVANSSSKCLSLLNKPPSFYIQSTTDAEDSQHPLNLNNLCSYSLVWRDTKWLNHEVFIAFSCTEAWNLLKNTIPTQVLRQNVPHRRWTWAFIKHSEQDTNSLGFAWLLAWAVGQFIIKHTPVPDSSWEIRIGCFNINSCVCMVLVVSHETF